MKFMGIWMDSEVTHNVVKFRITRCCITTALAARWGSFIYKICRTLFGSLLHSINSLIEAWMTMKPATSITKLPSGWLDPFCYCQNFATSITKLAATCCCHNPWNMHSTVKYALPQVAWFLYNSFLSQSFFFCWKLFPFVFVGSSRANCILQWREGRSTWVAASHCHESHTWMIWSDLIRPVLIAYHQKFGRCVSPRKILDAGSSCQLWTASLCWTRRQHTVQSSMCILETSCEFWTGHHAVQGLWHCVL